MAVTSHSLPQGQYWFGLSSDTKPLGTGSASASGGDMFYETDTGAVYIFSGSVWVLNSPAVSGGATPVAVTTLTPGADASRNTQNTQIGPLNCTTFSALAVGAAGQALIGVPGRFYGLNVTAFTLAPSITIYDALANTGTLILPTTTVALGAINLFGSYGRPLSTGAWIVVSGTGTATFDLIWSM